ncbi:MAG: hypothetical protein M3361_19635, partial [Candidatus Tectomicrobia bacterium]|nr:hypothetical protein [Candidatus Tectomicrobia bacterium]
MSTAEYLRFADGAKFFASLAQESVLTVASPAAFGFLGTNPAAMTLEGTRLRVNEGEALSVVGGDLTLAGGHLEAPSGRIQLASVAAPGEVGFSPLELAPDLQGDGFARLGRIALSQGASVKVGAEGSRHAGTIAVVGGQLTLSRGSRLSATTNSGGEGGRIVVTASTVRLMEDGRLEVDTTGQGNGGTIALRVGTLTLTGGARISSRTSGSGQAGTVTVAATEAITMTDSDLNVESRDTPSSRGAAGRIVVTAPTARLMGSEITARARSMSGNGGTIELQVGTLTVTDGSDISTSTNGTGQAGPLTITAHEAIAIAGRDRNGGESILSIRTRSQRSSGGEGGRLVIVTPRLSIGDGGLIRGGTLGEGNGGTIALRVGTLTVDGGTISVITTGEGSGGTIALQVGTLTLTNGGGITAGTEGPGQGGRLIITAREAVTITGQARTGVPSRLSS